MIKALQGLNSTVLKTIKQKGISTDKLRKLAEDLINRESLYNNKKDFGLITVRLHNFEPIYIEKKDIPKEQLVDYLIASCSLPIFKLTPMMMYMSLRAIIYGDFIMLLKNQVKPYEKKKGETDKLVDYWINKLTTDFASKKSLNNRSMKKNLKSIAKSKTI